MNTQTQHQTILDNPTVLERAVIYSRVSTDEQAESGTSLDKQLGKSLTYCAINNLHAPEEFIFNEDFTGKVLDRPELNKVRELLRAGMADHLVVYNANRLDRSESGVNLLILLMQELKPLGVAVHYSEINKRIDLHNPTEVFMYANFAGWQAGEDHRETVKKLHDGRINRAQSGYVVAHGNPPYGYLDVKENKRWHFEVVEAEAVIVRLIFQLYVIGDETGKTLTLGKIADKLNELGLFTRNGKIWRPATIHGVLANETYCGLWRYGKRTNSSGKWKSNPADTLIAVEVPAIISRELWQSAQEQLEHNKAFAQRNRKPGRYLLANRLICGDCGYRMSGCAAPGGAAKTPYLYYRCPTKIARFFKRECHLPPFKANVVDAKVWARLEEVSSDKDKLIDGLRGYQSQQESKVEPIKRELSYVEDLIKEKNAEWEDDYASMKFLPERAKARKAVDIANIENVLKELEKRKADLLAQLEDKSLSDRQIENIALFAWRVARDMKTLRRCEEDGTATPELRQRVYEGKRKLLELLDVQVKLFVLDGKRKAKIVAKYCPDGDELSVDLDSINSLK